MPTLLEKPESSKTVTLPPKVTFEEFTRMEERNIEWIDGRIVKYMSCSFSHEDLFRWLLSVLSLYVAKHNLGKVLGSRFAMRTKMSRGREPDLIFVANENLGKIKPTFLDGGADLVIEIVSPDSVERDKFEKFWEYEEIGIREYWLIDYESKIAEFYCLDEAGRYQLAEVTDGIYHSKIIKDFWLKTDWLWDLPSEFDVLKDLKVI